jgi:hypothetical protein
MRLFAWLRRSSRANARIREWRQEWSRAAAALDRDSARRLRAALEAEPPLADDVEVELEMMDGLERLITLMDELAAERLPRIETRHRIVGTDACHYSAPVSMPDEPAQPGGRLLLTGTRAVFLGSARLLAVPWHTATQALQAERDLLLVRHNGQPPCRFRCNTYADALRGAALARHLIATARERRR